jgi:hypothetical protein
MPELEEFRLLGPDGSEIAHGSLSAVTEPLLDSTARAATEQLLNDTAAAIEEEQRLVQQRERDEINLRNDTIQRLCGGGCQVIYDLPRNS